MRFRRRNGSDKVEIPMAPMIDVVFLLLIFFMCACSFKILESEIRVNLPVAATSTIDPENLEEVIIDITADGAIIVNEMEYDSAESRDLSQLRDMLSRLTQAFKTQAVIIRGDTTVSHGRVVDVLNACAAAEVKRVSFFTPEGE